MSLATHTVTLPAFGPDRRLSAWVGENWRMLGVLLAGAAIGWGVFATWTTVIEYSNHNEFCVTCEATGGATFQEHAKSSPLADQGRVHAGCLDCHAPRYSWIAEAEVPVITVGGLTALLFGGLGHLNNFERARPLPAKGAPARFEATNPHECRHCHDDAAMRSERQKTAARVKHTEAAANNADCVACHADVGRKTRGETADAPALANFDVR